MNAKEAIARAIADRTLDRDQPVPGCSKGCQLWYLSMDELFCTTCVKIYEEVCP